MLNKKSYSTYWALWDSLWYFWLATFWSPPDTGTPRRRILGRSPSSTWQDRQYTGRTLFHPELARLTSASPGRKISLESRNCNMTQVSVALHSRDVFSTVLRVLVLSQPNSQGVHKKKEDLHSERDKREILHHIANLISYGIYTYYMYIKNTVLFP